MFDQSNSASLKPNNDLSPIG
jgi:hypothetical protein